MAHWEAWDVENLPGLPDTMKVAEMVRWWTRSMTQKQVEADPRIIGPGTYFVVN